MRLKHGTFNRLIVGFVLFALISAQIAISAHAIQHPDHEFSLAAADNLSEHNQTHDDDNNQRPHECPECLAAKSFQNALASDSVFEFSVSIVAQTYSFPQNKIVQSTNAASYQPRAPPALLI